MTDTTNTPEEEDAIARMVLVGMKRNVAQATVEQARELGKSMIDDTTSTPELEPGDDTRGHQCPFCGAQSESVAQGVRGITRGRLTFRCGTRVRYEGGHDKSFGCKAVEPVRVERDALRAECERLRAERDAIQPVVEAAIRRRIAWLADDDDAGNIAADRAEDEAVDTYRALTETETK